MNKGSESYTQTPESSHSSKEAYGQIGETALLLCREQKRSEILPDAKNLTAYRKRLLDKIILPIETSDGINKCYDFLLDTVIREEINHITAMKNSVSRVLRLDGYKSPDWNEKDTLELSNAIKLDISNHILKSIRATYQEGGIDAVKQDFPMVKTSGTEWTQILTISKPTLEAYINNPEIPIGDSLKAIIECSNATSEHCGEEYNCPYAVRHMNGKTSYQGKRTDGRYRFYLNCPSGNLRRDFLVTYAKKCIDRRIPFDMKGAEIINDGRSPEPKRADGVIMYIQSDHLEDALEIMQEIDEEKPELTEKFGTPPITTGQMSFFGIAQSRREATWNYLFDRVSRWALFKTTLEAMLSSSKFAEKEKAQIEELLNNLRDNDGEELSKTNPNWSPEMIDYIKNNIKTFDGGSMRTRFNMNLKTLFSKANFGDKKHTNYPFCFSDAFYSLLEN